MSKKTDQKFLENQHKRIEIISHLSAIAGAYDAAMVDMSVIAWGNDKGEYWLRLLDMNGQGNMLLIHIDENLAPADKMYSVLGYIHHHGLEYGCNDWDQFNDIDAA